MVVSGRYEEGVGMKSSEEAGSAGVSPCSRYMRSLYVS